MTTQRITGWGRTAPAYVDLVAPRGEEELVDILHAGPVAARGLGRSYGDAAQLSGGVVLTNDAWQGCSAISEEGLITVGAGVSVDTLLTTSIPEGWFIPVTPGTRQVSMGGAVAADVHGKNHHRDGSFAHHVRRLRIVTPTGIFDASATQHADLFWATFGAMGLTGVVTEIDLQLMSISTNRVLVDTQRFGDLDGVMAAMSSGDDRYHYSVAWVDCMTRGSHMGRAILTRGDHATPDDVPGAILSAPRSGRITIPVDAPSGLLNPMSIRVFNEAWFRKAPRRREGESQSLGAFFHPLDGVADWNRLYGRRGFVQYQFCVDNAHEDVIERAIERLSTSGVPSFLAVLKRFGEGNPGPMSFPVAGWTLALDLPVGPTALPEVLNDLDEMVMNAGGRVYLAKDARLTPEAVRTMYPRLPEFLVIKRSVDPRGHLTSDLARRLHLSGE